MVRAADARRRRRELPGLCFRNRDELFDRFHRQRRMYDEQVRRRDDLAHGNEVFHDIETELGVEARADGERRGAEKQRMPVGGRTRDRLRADIARRACTVDDDDRLLPQLAQA
jgi:hypothetical protein